MEAKRILAPTEKELDAAWTSYEQRYYAGAGIVDQISFILMKRIGIFEAFTNDDHFRAAGFIALF